jgi:coenzyme F420 hydrogenase subunit beta
LIKETVKTENISWVSKEGFCHGCGACYAACPCDAIEITNNGRINYAITNDNCAACGLCNKVCSGQRAEVNVANSKLLHIIKSSRDIYLAYSSEKAVRDRGSSGGFITQYLLSLLEEKIINAAIVTTSDGPLKSVRASVARTSKEITAAIGSKYYPVSNCAALKDLEGNGKYAFVGKGCELSSLKLLRENVPRFKNLFHVTIGIFCHHTPYANASRKLLSSHGFTSNEKSEIIYRGIGWPGQTILKDNKREIKLDYKDSWCGHLGKAQNIPYRCSICTDSFAESADLAVGDAWALNQNLENKEGGFSLVLAYTQNGMNEIERIKKSKLIKIENVNKNLFLASQSSLMEKYETSHYRALFLRFLNKLSPIDHIGYVKVLKKFCEFIITGRFSLRKLLSSLNFVISKKYKK